MANLGHVANAAQNAVRNPRRPTCSTRDLARRVIGALDAEYPGRTTHDQRKLVGFVVLEPECHAETVAKRGRQQPRSSGRADQREGRQVEGQRSRRRALADDDVEPVVLEGRIEDLFDRAREPVDLVDEQDVPLLEPGQDRRYVALALQRRARDGTQPHTELFTDDVSEARLAEARRADQQEMVERLLAPASGFERDRELLLDALLADELVQIARPQ